MLNFCEELKLSPKTWFKHTQFLQYLTENLHWNEDQFYIFSNKTTLAPQSLPTVTINLGLGEKIDKTSSIWLWSVIFFSCLWKSLWRAGSDRLRKVHPDPCRASVNPRTSCRAQRKQTTLFRLFLFPSAAIVHLKLREGDRKACMVFEIVLRALQLCWLHLPVTEKKKTALCLVLSWVLSALKASFCGNRFALWLL